MLGPWPPLKPHPRPSSQALSSTSCHPLFAPVPPSFPIVPFPVPPGFDLMVAFGLVAKEYASVRGVAMEPSALGAAPTFTLFKDAQLMRRARCEGPREP